MCVCLCESYECTEECKLVCVACVSAHVCVCVLMSVCVRVL